MAAMGSIIAKRLSLNSLCSDAFDKDKDDKILGFGGTLFSHNAKLMDREYRMLGILIVHDEIADFKEAFLWHPHI